MNPDPTLAGGSEAAEAQPRPLSRSALAAVLEHTFGVVTALDAALAAGESSQTILALALDLEVAAVSLRARASLLEE